MTIEKGKEWGTPISVPEHVQSVRSDAELAEQPQNATCAVTAGDMWTTLGEPQQRHVGDAATLVLIDAMEITVVSSSGSHVLTSASNIQIGKLLGFPRTRPHQRFVCITNCGMVKRANMAPRAHPNDGVFDIVTFTELMSLKQRFMSARRLRFGTHVPHPNISVQRNSMFHTDRSHDRETLRIDGVLIRDWNSISVRILPDYWNLII